jgi:dolichol-phosphate mannosyltransferase
MHCTEGLVSIIVPTYQEALNLPHLVPRISAAMRKAGLGFEIVIVDDDSRDGSEQCVKTLEYYHPVRMIIRKQARGLSSAVVHGFRQARGEFLVCMDADLSHPPERIPALIEALLNPDIDFVIGSRYAEGGSTAEDWSLGRRLNSWVATQLARPLTRAKDPMSGFFALRRKTFEESAPLSPVGYKIGLEMMVKCRCRNISEVAIHFVDRRYGKTKLNLREQLNYLRHVKRLLDFKYGQWSRLLQFCLVGSSGAIVDLLTFKLCLLIIPLTAARAIAVGFAITSNFWFNRRLTSSYDRHRAWPPAYARFLLSGSVGGLVNWVVSISLVALFAVFQNYVIVAAVIGIGAGTISNFFLSSHWVFDGPKPGISESEPH